MHGGSGPDEQQALGLLFENASAVLWVFSADWTETILVSGAYEELCGRPVDGVREEATDFLGGIHPDDRETVRAAMERVSGGEPVEVEYRVNAEEDYRRWVWSRGRPVRNESGGVERVVGVTRDVTERKRYEEELRRRNERLEEFASVVSHDLRGPLSVVEGRVSLARDECEGCDEHLGAIDDAVERMRSIVDDTLTFARQGHLAADFEWIDAGSIAEESWGMVGSADVAAEFQIVEAFAIRCDPDRLRHALENLFGNAIEHGDDAVTVVRIGPIDGEGFYVEDDGFGIPEADRERVFEPGHSTTEDGTGFGLAIVRQVADAHGWDVTVTEGADGGARFEFCGVELDTDL